MSNREYILTEDNTTIGIKGLIIDYAGYKRIYYANRCLFQKLSPDNKFQFEATEQWEGGSKRYYLFEDAGELNHFLKICMRDELELIYFSIQKLNSIAYLNFGKQYFTFTRLF